MNKPDRVATQLAGIKFLLGLILGVMLLRLALDHGFAAPELIASIALICGIGIMVWAFFSGLIAWARLLDQSKEESTSAEVADPKEIDHPADKT